MLWACDEKRGTLHRKEGNGNESTRKKKIGRSKSRLLDKVRDDIKEKGLSADDLYDRATWRRMLSYVAPHTNGNKMKRKMKNCLSNLILLLECCEPVHFLFHLVILCRQVDQFFGHRLARSLKFGNLRLWNRNFVI